MFLSALLFTTFITSTAAQTGAVYLFNISPDRAQESLSTLAQQTNTPLLYLNEELKDVQVHGLFGEYTLGEALTIMLEGTGLSATITGAGVLTIREDDSRAANPDLLFIDPTKELSMAQAPQVGEPGALGLRFREGREMLPEEFLVTGSRIRQLTGMTTPVPVTRSSSYQLRFDQSGGTTADKLDILPQLMDTDSARRGGGALFGTAGGSYLDIRGMGPARTLVLYDGLRVTPADRNSSVNIDTLPAALVKRVDIVTGGASAAYGADALAGVVNFVIDRDYEGLSMSTSTGITEFGDGESWRVSTAAGTRWGSKAHLIGSLESTRINQISPDPERLENFRRWGFVTNPSWDPLDPPGTNPQRITLPDVHSTIHSPGGLINQPGFAYDRYTFTDDGTDVRPFELSDIYALGGPGSTWSQSGGREAEIADQAFNGGPYGAEVIANTLFAGITYDWTDDVNLIGQLMVGEVESNQLNRRGNPHLQTDTWHATIYRENPFLPENVRQAMDDAGLDSIRVDKFGQIRGRSNFDDNRNDFNRHISVSAMAGVEANLPDTWHLKGIYQHGQARKITGVENILRLDRLFMAMDAVVDPETGETVCNVQRVNPTEEQLKAATAGEMVRSQSGWIELPAPIGLDNSIEECVPLNIFGLGNVDPAASDYVADTKTGYSKVNQDYVEVLLNGAPFTINGDLVFMAFGMNWRRESFNQYSVPLNFDGPPRNVPELGIRGIPTGFLDGSTSLFQFSGVPNISGNFHVSELFSEINIPLLRPDSSWLQMDLDLGWRTSDYSLGGRVNSWKVGLDLTFTEDLRLRGTASRDVREATFSERFDIQGIGGSVEDPMWGNEIVDITVVYGGNPDLKPEIADTVTLGMVYHRALRNSEFMISADWYDIDLTKAIGQLGLQRIVDGCYQGVENLCGRITRNEEGMLVSVNNQYQHIDAARVNGVDLEFLFSGTPDFWPGESEFFQLNLLAGYLLENSYSPYGREKIERAGGINRPDLTAVLMMDYQAGPYGLRLQQRFIDNAMINTNWVEGVDVDDNTVASQSITNAGVYYSRVMANGATWRVSLDVNNLFDREPPVIPSFSQRTGAQLVDNNYDVFGRRYQLGFSLNF